MKKLLLAIFVFISSTIAYAQTPDVGGTLVFGRSGVSTLMDPSHATDGESFYAASAVYD